MFVVNVDWFFISHRLPLALHAKQQGYSIQVVSKDSGKLEYLQSLGIKTYDLEIDRAGVNPFRELKTISQLIRILKVERPHILHNITLKVCIYSSIAARISKTKNVINAISGLGYYFTSGNLKLTRIIIDQLMKIAFVRRNINFIFQNSDDESIFYQMGLLSGNKSCLIKGVGIDLDLYKFRQKEKNGGVKFVFTGRMLKDKGIVELIKASKIVLNSFSDTEIYLIGDIDPQNPGSLTNNELRDMIGESKISWIGPQINIIPFLEDSDVMVFPSYREGLPKSLMEALAVGLPVITTDTSGCRDCVDDGINGFLVPVGDYEILANKMSIFINSPELIKSMGLRSRKKAELEFDQKIIFLKTTSLYPPN